MTTTTSSTAAPSTAGTGSSIISALGSGSGINSSALVTQLVDISKVPESNRLTAKQTLLESQISDFGLLRSSFSKLETAASALSNADSFNAKSVSIPTTTLLSITKLEAAAAAGTYSMNVDQVAKAQSVSSADFASQTAPVGKGTLAIRFGTWDAGATAFTVDSTKTGGTITIDDSNNSLVGVRDAINKANLGVTASVVSNAGQYKLLLTSPSGASSEVEITATEAVGSPGLTSFDFNQTTRNMTQQQGGQDALLHINGMALTRSSNHVTDVIPGLEIDLANSSLTETVNITVTADKTVAEKAIRDFVAAYNTFLSESNKLVGFDKEKNDYGSLRQDPLAKNLIQQVRTQLNSSVTGLSNTFVNLSNLGINTELDGTLKIDDTTAITSFRSAMDNNYDAVRDLFIAKTSSSSAQIEVTKNSANSTPGSYDVVITQQPAKGSLIGGVLPATFPLDTTGKVYGFIATIDGVDTNTIGLPTTTYATGADLAADIQTRINSDANITAGKVSVSVAYNTLTNTLEFTSNAFGSSSNVSFSATSPDMADLGISDLNGTAGADVGGTVGGVAAFGFGDVLLPAIGSKAEGLSMRIAPGTTSGTITFSRGFAGTFTNLIDDFLKTSGMIKAHETSISQQVDKVKTAQTALDKRSESYRARLQAQFSAMESIVRGLKSTGSFLTGAFKALSGDTSS